MNTIVTYQCPNCGAGLPYNAEKLKFVCEFCLSEFSEEEVKAANQEQVVKEKEAANQAFNDSMRQYVCQSCGAEIIADANTAADFCYYCHNPVVLSDKVTGEMKPDRIIPFKYDRKSAADKFMAHAKKKIFLPSDFLDEKQIEHLSGIYYPFWVTDADTDCHLDGEAANVRKWRSGDKEYTETTRFLVHRRADIHFEDITTSALSDGDKKMMEGILPYPSDALEEFSLPYLSGFLAKKRNLSRDDVGKEVKGRIDGYAQKMLRSTVRGYDSFHQRGSGARILKSHWDYALMPVWVMTYRDKKGKIYTYTMNGHTGKVFGQFPVSPVKLSILFGAVFAAASPFRAVVAS